MLDKKDFLEFCNQLMSIEVEMESRAFKLIAHIKDKKAIAILKGIVESEKKHETIVSEITKIIKKYYA